MTRPKLDIILLGFRCVGDGKEDTFQRSTGNTEMNFLNLTEYIRLDNKTSSADVFFHTQLSHHTQILQGILFYH